MKKIISLIMILILLNSFIVIADNLFKPGGFEPGKTGEAPKPITKKDIIKPTQYFICKNSGGCGDVPFGGVRIPKEDIKINLDLLKDAGFNPISSDAYNSIKEAKGKYYITTENGLPVISFEPSKQDWSRGLNKYQTNFQTTYTINPDGSIMETVTETVQQKLSKTDQDEYDKDPDKKRVGEWTMPNIVSQTSFIRDGDKITGKIVDHFYDGKPIGSFETRISVDPKTEKITQTGTMIIDGVRYTFDHKDEDGDFTGKVSDGRTLGKVYDDLAAGKLSRKAQEYLDVLNRAGQEKFNPVNLNIVKITKILDDINSLPEEGKIAWLGNYLAFPEVKNELSDEDVNKIVKAVRDGTFDPDKIIYNLDIEKKVIEKINQLNKINSLIESGASFRDLEHYILYETEGVFTMDELAIILKATIDGRELTDEEKAHVKALSGKLTDEEKKERKKQLEQSRKEQIDEYIGGDFGMWNKITAMGAWRFMGVWVHAYNKYKGLGRLTALVFGYGDEEIAARRQVVQNDFCSAVLTAAISKECFTSLICGGYINTQTDNFVLTTGPDRETPMASVLIVGEKSNPIRFKGETRDNLISLFGDYTYINGEKIDFTEIDFDPTQLDVIMWLYHAQLNIKNPLVDKAIYVNIEFRGPNRDAKWFADWQEINKTKTLSKNILRYSTTDYNEICVIFKESLDFFGQYFLIKHELKEFCSPFVGAGPATTIDGRQTASTNQQSPTFTDGAEI